MDYQRFKKSFEASGKTQKDYGKDLSMSASMVHYYLRKAKAEGESTIDGGSFSELTIQEVKGQEIKIMTRSGLQITIPI